MPDAQELCVMGAPHALRPPRRSVVDRGVMTSAPAVNTPPLLQSGGGTSAGTRRVTRDDILDLAKRGRHWEFITWALRLLQQVPQDHGTRLIVATSYARLGLPSSTREHLDALPEALQAEASVLSLRVALPALGRDEIPFDELSTRVERALEALASRGVDLRAHREAWSASRRGERWFRARDGNIVRRSAGARPDEPWIHFRDDRAEAAAFPLPHQTTTDKTARPFAMEGAFPPWLFQRLYASTPTGSDGHRTRITLVQEDPLELFDALACEDLCPLLADDRVEMVIGPGAGTRFRALLDSRAATRAGGPAITLASVRRTATPSVVQTMGEFARAQGDEQKRLIEQVRAIYAGRDHAWWRQRYANPAEPLRVLVPTCRYSTFVRHSAADLAEAFSHAGWESRVLIEPDDRSHLSSIAYLREMASFTPDLIVLINYTRRGIGDFLPAEVPFICWLQDAMPHQFDAALSAAQGPLDFLAGYLHRELFEQFGFERRRCAVFPVAVSARKFHPGPVTDAQRARHSCDIAYVSHHSETPDAMHRRLVAEAGAKEPRAAAIFEALRRPVDEISRATMDRLPGIELQHAAKDAARRVLGAEPPESTLTLITRQYCFAMADRIIRHQTLTWAAAIAERRGWRLHLYGRGWESHPTLASFARGELSHDDDLRASYALAGVHLHASSNWLLHQRVMECALAGGLPLVRLKRSDLVQWECAVAQRLAHEGSIIMERRTPLLYREYGYACADHPMAMEYLAQMQRLGIDVPWDMWMHGRRYDEYRATPIEAIEPPAGWILGDLSSTTFRDERELEALVERAITDSAWRRSTSGMISHRVRQRYTTDAIGAAMRRLVTDELSR